MGPEDPVEAPEAPIDNRSLFEKLQEQKDLKEMQWQEEHDFKNNTFNKALEEDEAQFLDAVDAARCNAERQKGLAEKAKLEEFQKTQQELRERELEERIRAETRNPSVVVGHHQQYCLFPLFMFILCLKLNSFNLGAKVDREAEIIPAKVIGGSCEAERCSRCEGGGQGAE